MKHCIYDKIPQSLKPYRQWVAWGKGMNTTTSGEVKIDKTPISPGTGAGAKANDPATWGTFDEAVARAKQDQLAGVGFEFSDSDEFTGFDFDDCIDNHGAIHPEVKGYVKRLGSYTEVSPSGTGLKVFTRGKFSIPRNKVAKNGYDAEAYNDKRYFTVTGNRLDEFPADVVESPEAEAVYKEIFCVTKDTSQKKAASTYTFNVDDAPEEAKQIQSALKCINPNDYETWRNVGFSLKWWESQGANGVAKPLWDEWSKGSDKFDQSISDKQWQSYRGDHGANPPITLRTLYKLAKEGGWVDSRAYPYSLGPSGNIRMVVTTEEGEKQVAAQRQNRPKSGVLKVNAMLIKLLRFNGQAQTSPLPTAGKGVGIPYLPAGGVVLLKKCND